MEVTITNLNQPGNSTLLRIILSASKQDFAHPLTVLNMKNGELTNGMRPASPRVSAGVGAKRRFSRSLPTVGSLFPHFDNSPWRCKLVEKPEEVWMNGVLSAMLTSLLFRATHLPKGNIFWQTCNEMHSNEMTDPQMYFGLSTKFFRSVLKMVFTLKCSNPWNDSSSKGYLNVKELLKFLPEMIGS